MKLDSVPLARLAAVHSGGGAPQEASAFGCSGYPFVRAGSLTKLVNGEGEDSLEKLEPSVAERFGLKLFPSGTVLFAKSGMSATKGHVYRLRGDAYVVNHLAALVPHDQSDGPFLERALQRFSATSLIRDPAYPSIRLGDIERMKILAPCDAKDRRRIADILDKADALRAKRRAALAQLDTLTQSIFLDMFGDPATNLKGWPRRRLADLCTSPEDIKCGPFGTQLAQSEYTTEGVPLWGIRHVNAFFRLPTREFLEPRTARRLNQYSIKAGDIVMTRKGTVGNCAVYPADLCPGIMHSDLLRLRVDRVQCAPIFVAHQLHFSRDVERQLALISGGAIMPGVNVTKLKLLEVVVPSVPLQRDFASRAAAVERAMTTLEASANTLDALFASLLHGAFRGELSG